MASQDKVVFEIIATAKGVKVVQQQVDKLAKTTDRADTSTKKLSKSRDSYNRKEKGAAQISSNSTKNFSKMQQGIDGGGGSGGLVRAYALLAANVFALTAAFGVLSRSAQIDTLTQSMEVLSTTGGTYIKSLAKNMQEASGFAIDLAQSFRQVSLAASAGLNTSEIEGLTKVAKGAAISLGRNLPDAMDRIFRGAIKLEPEILDEIGLFIRVDEASQKYALSLGKSVSSITQVEKRQAFLNEILDQGGKKFKEYAEEIKPDPYVRLGAALGDIAQSGISMVNGVLGPLLNLLAESKGILTAVFGVLIFSLLKKAIPAMGEFNTKIAANAKEAADNAREYQAGITENTTVAVQEANKQLAKDKEILESKRRLTGKGQITNQGAQGVIDKKLKTEVDLDKRRNLLLKKRDLLVKKIHTKNIKNQAILKSDLVDMDLELKNLVRQQEITDQIAANKLRGNVPATPGQLTDLRQKKLDDKASGTTILAGASNMTEQQGVKAGFTELNRGLKENEGKLGKFQKGMVRAKGSVSILGSGLSRLMMIMGPWMMALSIASPLLAKLGSWLGFGNEESKKLGKTLEAVGDQVENVTERFNKQIDAMENLNFTWREQNKAQTAFNKNAGESAGNIIKLSEELAAYKNELGMVAGAWQFLKGIIDISEEDKTAKLQIAETVALITAAAKSGDKGMNSIFSEEVIGGVDAFRTSLVAVGETEAELGKMAGSLSEERQKQINRQVGSSMTLKQAESNRASNFNLGAQNMNFVEFEYVKALIKSREAIENSTVAQEAMNITEETSVQTGMDIIKLTEERVKIYESMESALEGASEGIAKFQASFRAKTKVDSVIGNFDQLSASLKGLKDLSTEEYNTFFDKFKDSDNPFNKLFLDTDGTQEGFETAIEAAKEKLKEFQMQALTSANAIKVLGVDSKLMIGVFNTGGVAAIEIQKKLTEIEKKKNDIQKSNTDTLLLSNGYTREGFAAVMEGLNAKGTEVERAQELGRLKLTEIDLLGIQAQFDKEAVTNINRLIAVAQQANNILKRDLELEQKKFEKKKEILNLDLQIAANATKLSNLQGRGTSETSDQQAAEAKISAAMLSYELAKEENKMKMAMLQIEAGLMADRYRVLFEQGKLVGVTKEQAEATIKNMSSNPLFSPEGLQKQSTLAAQTMNLAIATAVSDGFGKGLLSGLIANTAAIKLRAVQDAIDRAKAVAAAEKAVRDEGAAGFEQRAGAAGVQAGKDFDAGKQKDNGMQALRGSLTAISAQFSELGPEGAVVMSVIAGATAIGDSWYNVGEVFSLTGDKAANSMEKGAAVAAAVAQTLGAISGIMAANSKAQISEVDGQIAAEKKRDGKSKESLAKIAQMEKKKEGMARKAFEQNKKMQIATTIANTAASIMQVWANPADITKAWAMPMSIMIGALGAAQVGIISKTKFNGGSTESPKPQATTMSVGSRQNSVDVSQGGSRGELSYMRGARGSGSNANNFNPGGGAMGRKSYASGGEGILVGEQGPEVVMPSQKVDVIPNSRLGGSQNVNFSINAVDAAGVEDLLVNQRGNIIRMIREAANDTGERFLETVDTQAYGSST